MHIDFGQIITHIIGFLLAVWLLKRYAWQSILGFVEKRRQHIVDSFNEIEREKASVLEQKRHYDMELQKIEETRREKIQQAAREAEHVATQIRDEARRDAITLREKAEQDISMELDKANETLKDRMIESVLMTTEKILRERLDRDKHNQLISDFLSKVKVN